MMETINGETKTCGLIGNPVCHTLSPVIHNTLAGKLGHNLVYVPFQVESDQVRQAVDAVKALRLLGVNVTVPYKSAVIPYLDQLDDLAKKIGAVNTIVREGNQLTGYNTDMPGLYRAMCSEGIAVEDESVLILGAGGAARAVAMLCASHQAKEIYVLNRTLDHAAAIAREVNGLFQAERIVPLQITDFDTLPQRSYIAIQATSVGLYPDCGKAVIEEKRFYDRIRVGVDLIYNPGVTQFMKYLNEQGKQTMNGLKMLLYQGIIAYELWNQCKVSDELAQEVLEAMKKAMSDKEHS